MDVMVFISWNKTQNILHNVSETDAKCCLFSVVGHFVKKKTDTNQNNIKSKRDTTPLKNLGKGHVNALDEMS